MTLRGDLLLRSPQKDSGRLQTGCGAWKRRRQGPGAHPEVIEVMVPQATQEAAPGRPRLGSRSLGLTGLCNYDGRDQNRTVPSSQFSRQMTPTSEAPP